VRRFFGVSGRDYDRLFALHPLEHKTCGNPARAAFDALCCDGSANYAKLLRVSDAWVVADCKARSFRREARAELEDWLVETYSTDTYEGPPPVTAAPTLLKYKEAGRAARTALQAIEAERSEPVLDGRPEPAVVYYPLGLGRCRVQPYKVLKPSAFLFRNPRQHGAWVRAMGKFTDASSCGLELLALRRGVEGRRKGSIVDVAAAVYRLIRKGVLNPTKVLNLNRLLKEPDPIAFVHRLTVLISKKAALQDLIRQIDESGMDPAATLTGLFVRAEDVYRLA
jgi:hypothetical protein